MTSFETQNDGHVQLHSADLKERTNSKDLNTREANPPPPAPQENGQLFRYASVIIQWFSNYLSQEQRRKSRRHTLGTPNYKQPSLKTKIRKVIANSKNILTFSIYRFRSGPSKMFSPLQGGGFD
jgi:hypothetical protein